MIAGLGEVDITPTPGTILNGFIARTSASTGVDTPLWARALVLESQRTRALILSFDLLGLAPAFADRLAENLGSFLGISPDQVILACTHTHSGPVSARLRGIGDSDSAYLTRIERAAADAAREAVANAAPVRASWAAAPLVIACNRRQEVDGPAGVSVMLGRNPGGPHDRTVRVLRLEGERGTILLFHHACHPYCLGGDSTLISADFWGHAAEALAAEGYRCIYLNGCCGNLSPELAFGGPAAAQETGRQVADAVRRALRAARPSLHERLEVRSRRFALPHDTMPPLPDIEAGLSTADRTVRDTERGDPRIVERIRRAWGEWITELRAATAGDRPLPPVPARVSVARIGDGAIVALPGEVFYETGRDLAARLGAEPVCVAAYCHGYIGYVPTPESFPLGGYEVEEAHRYIGLWRVSPQATSIIADQVLNLWESCGGTIHEQTCAAGRA